jgi:Helix-turn-helix domain
MVEMKINVSSDLLTRISKVFGRLIVPYPPPAPSLPEPPAGASLPRIESPYLNVREAAAYLRKTVSALYTLHARGRVRSMQGSPGRLMFTRESLDAYLAKQFRR